MSNEEDVVRKVQALWAKADDPAATGPEREAFVAKARELMAKHAIDEIVLSEASKTEEAVVVADILLFASGNKSSEFVSEQRKKLAHYISMHHRCQGIITTKHATVREDGTPQYAGEYMILVGFKSDVTMVRLMYRSLGTDMITACMLEPTEHLTRKEKNVFDVSFCEGYALRIERRLAEVDRRVEEMAEADGSLLPVLMSRKDLVQRKVKDMFPNLTNAREKRFTFDPDAAARGKAAADKANLGSATGIGGSRGVLGS